MFKLDFSDINNNGFRINQFRLFHSHSMRDHKYSPRMEELKIADDLIGERELILEYLQEHVQINYTRYFFSSRILVVLILIGILTLLMYNGELIMRLLPIVSASVFYFLSIRFKESFVMGHVGIQITKCIYDSKIAEKYNF